MTTAAPKRMRREDRRAALLDAAASVVGDRSQRLTFEAIAAQAGVSPTLPYKYFESVDDVALELYNRTVQDVDDAIDQLLADADLGFDDKVRKAFLLWCDMVRRDDFLFVRLAEGADAPGLSRAVHRRRERAAEVWAAEIGREFALTEPVARVVAAVVNAGASAAVQRLFADRLERDVVADLVVRLVRGQCEAAQG